MRKKHFFWNLLPVLAITASVLFGCKPDAPVDYPNTDNGNNIPKHNVELEFDADNTEHIHMDTIQKYVRDNSVDTIYMVLYRGSTFGGYSQKQITLAKDYLKQRTDISPRVRGRGDFLFRDDIVVLPEDSLWFVSKGWTVNKGRQY